MKSMANSTVADAQMLQAEALQDNVPDNAPANPPANPSFIKP